MKSPTFTFLLQTDHGNGRTSEVLLATTGNRDRARMLRSRFSSIAGVAVSGRNCKKVKVVKVDAERFSVFSALSKPPQAGEVYPSIDALAEAMGSHPVTLRAGISRARSNKLKTATVRGVTYAYAA